MTTMWVRGLDPITTADELKEAIYKTAIKDEINTTVSIVKMIANNRDTQTAKIRLANDWAERLFSTGKIKVGIVRCQIKREEGRTMCHRCWKPGHLQRDCEDTDRSGDCFNCGKTGHKAAACSSPSFCNLCDQPGHRTFARGCPGRKDTKVGRKDRVTNQPKETRTKIQHPTN